MFKALYTSGFLCYSILHNLNYILFMNLFPFSLNEDGNNHPVKLCQITWEVSSIILSVKKWNESCIQLCDPMDCSPPDCSLHYRQILYCLSTEKILWSRKWQPAPVCLPGEFCGQRSLVGYTLWGHKESDTTEWLTLSLSSSILGFYYFPTCGFQGDWAKWKRNRLLYGLFYGTVLKILHTTSFNQNSVRWAFLILK